MQSLLLELVRGQALSEERMREAFELIMTGRAEPSQVGALLAMVQQRGVSVDELVGAARVMRACATPVRTPAGFTVVDTCGTGGDGASTFNISTAAALVAAGAGHSRGLAVAKHGNKAVTSQSGSSQVLAALGVTLQVTSDTLTRCLQEAGVCFCFAPSHHPAMKHAAPIRQQLGFRTMFNLLGPLTNPAGVRRQVIGVYAAEWTRTLAHVLRRLGAEEAMVVHGRLGEDLEGPSGGLDEVSTLGPTLIGRLHEGDVHVASFDARELGLASATPASLHAADVAASAQVITRVLAGETGPAREIVCVNAAAALIVGGIASGWAEGCSLAQDSIDRGLARAALQKLVRLTAEGAIAN